MKTRRRDILAQRQEAQRHQYDAMLDNEDRDDDEHDGYQPVRERPTPTEEGEAAWQASTR